MIYLKHFENFENTQMGITEDEIKECFYDLSDDGWVVAVKFDKKMKSSKLNKAELIYKAKSSSIEDIFMDLIPFIGVKIHKKFPEKSFTQELMDLQESKTYKSCVGSLLGRLEEHELLIDHDKIERLPDGGCQIFILICRKSDEVLVSNK